MKKILFAALFLSVLNVGAALAQTQTGVQTESVDAARKSSQVQVQYKQTTRYDFDDDKVEGKLVRPDGDPIDARGRSRFSSMVKPRLNFIPEMTKSVEGL